MQIINGTDYEADLIQSIDKHGKKFAVIIVKGTFAFPAESGQVLQIAEQQVPIIAADAFEGEPGLSNPYFESEYVGYKARCDIVVKATAHAPEGKAVRKLQAGFQFADLKKTVQVVGDRVWKLGFFGLRRSWPKPFTTMPVTYARAFGGTWYGRRKDGAGVSYLRNPVGSGFGRWWYFFRMLGKPLPNLEQPGKPVRWKGGNYKPWSFGPIGRSWDPRRKYGGTYDKKWLKNTFPLLPADFDERYFQCVPENQQTTYPQGGEEVRLTNLHPQWPEFRFNLPAVDLPMSVQMTNYRNHLLKPVVDTITIDADAHNVTIVWRSRQPIKRSLREIESIVIGDPNDERVKAALGNDDGCGCGCNGFTTGYVAPVLEDLEL